MPSPVAHSLAGLALAHFALRRRTMPPDGQRPSQSGSSGMAWIFWAVALAFAANAADLDFLLGFWIGDPNKFHHGPTHSLIAAVPFGLVAAALASVAGFGRWRRFGVLMGLSYSTHVMLDLMTQGTREPHGMKLLWPFLSEPLTAPFHLFMDIRRDGGTSTFLPSLVQWHNAEAVAWELAVMAGVWIAYRAISLLPQFSVSGTAPERKIQRSRLESE